LVVLGARRSAARRDLRGVEGRARRVDRRALERPRRVGRPRGARASRSDRDRDLGEAPGAVGLRGKALAGGRRGARDRARRREAAPSGRRAGAEPRAGRGARAPGPGAGRVADEHAAAGSSAAQLRCRRWMMMTMRLRRFGWAPAWLLLAAGAASAASPQQLLYFAAREQLRRIDIDTIDRPPMLEDVLINSTGPDETAIAGPLGGGNVNGTPCFFADGTFVMGEDAGQPHPPPGWAVFDPNGRMLGKLVATGLVKLPDPSG